MKLYILYGLALALVNCQNVKTTVRQITDNTPMNPVVAYLHKDDVGLKGAVKTAGYEHFDANGNTIKNMTDTYTHSDTQSTMQTGDVLYTFLKNKKGQIVELVISGTDESTFFTYYKNGLLATEYGVESGIAYKTVYEYDANDRIIKYTYTYGKDPVQILNYAYTILENNIIEVIITHNDNELQEKYSYQNGNLVASTRDGDTVRYSYKFDKNGNWIAQSTSDGSTTKRVLTYY